MSKFKYRLREQEEGGEEESGLKKPRKNYVLILSSDKYTADQLLDIINDPSNLIGKFVKRDPGLENLELRVFGDKKKSKDFNTKLYSEEGNGLELYDDIFKITGEKFKKGTQFFEINPETNKPYYYFPEKSRFNLDLVKKYYVKKTGDKAVKSSLNPTKMDNKKLKFKTTDRKYLEGVLDNAKLDPNKDYNLQTIPDDEVDTLKEKLNKILKNVR